MNESAPSAGLRKVKRTHYVQITNDTVRDTRISYRALGILTELLSHEDGWVVRTKDLGKRRKEGTDAIAAALRELAAAGYYRVERRRYPSGKFSMGTAVADYPIESWAEDFKRNPRGGVPVRVDENGNILDEPAGTDSPEPGFPDPVTETGFPGPGDPGPGSPVPLEDPSQNTNTERSAALRAATADPPVETSSSSKPSVTREAAAAADVPGDAARAGGARPSMNPADILAAMMINPDEAQRFRTWLVDATGAMNPEGVIVSLHATGRLSERLSQWRASENPTLGAVIAVGAAQRPQHPQWCGMCDPTTRTWGEINPDGRDVVHRCEDCNANAGYTPSGAGAAQAIAIMAQGTNRTPGAGRAAFEAARAALPAGTPRRDTTFGTTIDPTTAREIAESEHRS